MWSWRFLGVYQEPIPEGVSRKANFEKLKTCFDFTAAAQRKDVLKKSRSVCMCVCLSIYPSCHIFFGDVVLCRHTSLSLLRWTSLKRKIMEVIAVYQLEDNKHDHAIGCKAFMEVKIGQERSRQAKIGQDRWEKLLKICETR